MSRRSLFLGLLLISQVVFAQKTLIHCGSLIDGKSNDVQSQVTLIVEGNKITAIEKGFKTAAAGDNLIDLSKKTVMPGLIDMHVHLEGETNKDQALQEFTLNDADIAFWSAQLAQRTLMAGFTTVRDLGGSGVNTSLRNAVNQVRLWARASSALASRSPQRVVMPTPPTDTGRISWATRAPKTA